MKLARMITMAVIAVVGPEGKADVRPSVSVYLTHHNQVPRRVLGQAQFLAERMFGNIGVNLRWSDGAPRFSERDLIVINVVSGTASAFKPGALAFALPYEGIHIEVLWDRIAGFEAAERVLAHVMVHEIVHLLQNVERHSSEGVMKARWTRNDYALMGIRTLRFTADDLDLIYRGIENRRKRLTVASAAVTR